MSQYKCDQCGATARGRYVERLPATFLTRPSARGWLGAPDGWLRSDDGKYVCSGDCAIGFDLDAANRVAEKRRLEKHSLRVLLSVKGVEAVFYDDECVIVAAREHGEIDRDDLLRLEDQLGRLITVRAHQGRGVDSVAGEWLERVE